MSAKQPWKTPRLGADGKPHVDAGGPCSNCPPKEVVTPEVSKKRVELIERLTRGLEGAALVDALATVTRMIDTAVPCAVCNKGFVRVCRTCDGHVRLEKTLIKDNAIEVYEEEEEVEIEPEISTLLERPMGETTKNILRPAVMGKAMVTKTRPIKVDAWINGPPCPTCHGTGAEGITEAEVASG